MLGFVFVLPVLVGVFLALIWWNAGRQLEQRQAAIRMRNRGQLPITRHERASLRKLFEAEVLNDAYEAGEDEPGHLTVSLMVAQRMKDYEAKVRAAKRRSTPKSVEPWDGEDIEF